MNCYHTMFAACLLAGFGLNAIAAETPYLTPVAPDVTFTSVLNVGDAANNGYRMVGIPDGLGVYDNKDGTFTVLMNHELGSGVGTVRGHGAKGAFVSRWVVRKSDLSVLSGEDLVQSVQDAYNWNGVDWVSGATALNRLCSADLAGKSAFRHDGKGYNGHIFLNGEEAGDEGRALAWIASGDEAGRLYQLPALGRFNIENLLASPYAQKKTIVMGMDDDGQTDSEVYVYVGTKQDHGNAVEMAGLHNGSLYGVRVLATNQTEDAITGFGAARLPFVLTNLGQAANKTGAALEVEGMALGVSNFRRVEDGAWSPIDPRKFYFLTTADFNTHSRLWRMTFKDIEHPEKGGMIDLLLDGGDGVNQVRMLDNMTIAANGDLILQEDPGNQAYLAKVWRFNERTGRLSLLAEHDVSRFADNIDAVANPATLDDYHTQDEESSGVVDVTRLFEGIEGYDTDDYRYFLLDVQAHKGYKPDWTVADKVELVEAGQLLLMKVAK